jgi:flagellar protein FlgJ
MDVGSASSGAQLTSGLALDAQGLSRLKRAAGAQAAPEERQRAIKESARQVEAMFVMQLMKSMRSTRMDSGLFNNQVNEHYEVMLEQQRAQAISARGLGLSNVIAKQLQTISQPKTSEDAQASTAQREIKWSAPSSTSP